MSCSCFQSVSLACVSGLALPPQVSLSLSLARARPFSLALALSFSRTHLFLPFYCSLLSHTRDSLPFLYILTGLLFLARWLSCSFCLSWLDSSTRLPFIYCIMSHTLINHVRHVNHIYELFHTSTYESCYKCLMIDLSPLPLPTPPSAPPLTILHPLPLLHFPNTLIHPCFPCPPLTVCSPLARALRCRQQESHGCHQQTPKNLNPTMRRPKRCVCMHRIHSTSNVWQMNRRILLHSMDPGCVYVCMCVCFCVCVCVCVVLKNFLCTLRCQRSDFSLNTVSQVSRENGSNTELVRGYHRVWRRLWGGYD